MSFFGLFGPNIKKMKENGDIDSLLAQLENEETKFSNQAQEAIIDIGIPSLTPLANKLDHNDQDVRIKASFAIGKILNQSTDVLSSLCESKNLPDFVRIHDVKIQKQKDILDLPADFFCSLGKNVLPHFDDSNEIVRQNAVWILNSIIRLHGHSNIDLPLFEPLIARLKDSYPPVRVNAAHGLGVVGDRTAIDALIPLLEDRDPEVRASVAFSLNSLGDFASRRLISNLSRQDESIRKDSDITLHDIGVAEIDKIRAHLVKDPHDLESITDELLAGFQDKSLTSPLKIMVNLGQPIVETLLSIISRNETQEKKHAAALALIRLGPDAEVQLINAMRYHKDDFVRIISSWALNSIIENEEKDDRLYYASHDTGFYYSWYYDEGSSQGFYYSRGADNGKAKMKTMIISLIAALGDGQKEVRQNAASALGHICNINESKDYLRDLKPQNSLIQCLIDEDATVRQNAAWSLGEIAATRCLSYGDEQMDVLNGLVEALKDIDPNVRFNAAEALGKFANYCAKEPLMKAAGFDCNSEVRTAAILALRKIG